MEKLSALFLEYQIYENGITAHCSDQWSLLGGVRLGATRAPLAANAIYCKTRDCENELIGLE
jgi:hypothetical protein